MNQVNNESMNSHPLNQPGYEILADGYDGKVHVRFTPVCGQGLFSSLWFGLVLLFSGMGFIGLFARILMTTLVGRYPVNTLVLYAGLGFPLILVSVFVIQSYNSGRNKKIVELIVDAGTVSIVLNGATLANYTKADFHDIWLERVHLPFYPNVEWALCFHWNTNNIYQYRFYAPRGSDMASLEGMMRKSLDLPAEKKLIRFAITKYLLVLKKGALVPVEIKPSVF